MTAKQKKRAPYGNWFRLSHAAFVCAGLLALALVVSTPLPMTQQAVIGGVAFLAAMLLAKRNTRWSRFALAVAAVIVTSRYLYWRLTSTLDFSSVPEALLGLLMLAAELYLWLVLVLSFTQTLWGRDRKPAPLPADPADWPTVDVYIPTYNESLDIVANTVLAAQRMEYPANKFRVFILDDGRRPEFAKFAAEAGCQYLIRPDNKHAKAGNLNHALKKTDGELIAIFDCDHVPVRGFLQLTVGWFLKDKRMALVQTPHFFYNQDPFEKNLQSGDRLSNEGLLFYGLLQDGNDFWNASFFCGSCAVVRRTALEEIGGIAVETVTEDAHTSLKLQRRGWNSAFLRRPLAAGLATDSLAIHIGQRMRWARGMIQIFRLDNPFLGRGLTLAQRVCYANAMLHFMFPLPRLFLLAMPLAFLVFGFRVISASAWEILAYSLPALAVATVATTALQGRHRQPFWGEIYETTLAFHLAWPTIMTFLQPHKGKFNVTSKGQRSSDSYLDMSVLKPQIAFFLIMLAAFLYGVVSVFVTPLAPDVVATTLINAVWAAISAAFVFISISVGRERREVRAEPRINAEIPVTVYFEDGRAFPAVTDSISLGGAQLRIPNLNEPHQKTIGVEMIDNAERLFVPANTVAWKGDTVRVSFQPQSMDDRAGLVRVVLGRTAAWKGWDDWRPGSTGLSLKLIGEAMAGFVQWCGVRLKAQVRLPFAREMSAGLVALLSVAGLAAWFDRAHAQVVPPISVVESGSSGFTGPLAEEAPKARTFNVTLDKFGVLDAIRLQGRMTTRGVGFTLRADYVVTSARFVVPIAFSPNLDPANSQVTIQLNGQTIHTAALSPLSGTSAVLEFDVDPNLFLRDNNLVFRAMARRSGAAADCNTEDTSWVEISNRAELRLSVDQLATPADLAHLPMPFFDRRDSARLELPFVFASRPGAGAIEAASIVASFWGVETSYRGARFPVSFQEAPDGNAVVFLTSQDQIEKFGAPPIAGPSISVVANPYNPSARLLLIMGRDEEELKAAARSLSLAPNILSGPLATVQAPQMANRRPYDAPRWIPTDRPIKLGELVESGRLEGRGLSPGVLSANLLTAPDLFSPDAERGIPMKLSFRTPGEQWIDLRRSRLDVLANDSYVRSLSLVDPNKGGMLQSTESNNPVRTAEVSIPAYLVYGQTQLQFYFDLQTRKDGVCPPEPGELRTSIDPTSEIDLSGLHRHAKLPNLAFLAQAGYPFTRMADLSETAVILSPDFLEQDLQALFQMMGSFGAKTGYPSVRVSIGFPGNVASHANKDILVIGTYANQELIKSWSRQSAFEFVDGSVRVRTRPALERMAGGFASLLDDDGPSDLLQLPVGNIPAAMYGFESPLTPKRTVVVLAAQDGDGLVRLAEAATISDRVGAFQGDFVTVSDESIHSARVAKPYYVGELPALVATQWWLSRRPWAVPSLMLLSILLVSVGTFAAIKRRSSAIEKSDRENEQ